MRIPTRLGDVLLPLALMSAIANGLVFWGASGWLVARWGLLGLLALHIIAAGRVSGTVSGPFLLTSVIYLFWCGTTIAWSEIPALSFAKVVALALVGFTAFLGAQNWIFAHSRRASLYFLLPTTAMSLAAGVIPANPDQFGTADMPVYAGATINPNFLGAIVAMCLPLLAWGAYSHRHERQRRLLWFGLLGLFLVVLYLTSSRAAYLIAFGIVLGFVATLGVPRKVSVALGGGWLVMLLLLLAPEATWSWVERNIYKQQVHDDVSVFNSRTRVWEDSYAAAQMGGWTGLGYGISANSDPSTLTSTFTARGYGREKGNSQLAIVEETGLAGLALYAALLVTLFWPLVVTLRSATGDSRVLLGIAIGTLVGMLGQSLLEAWWVAPGSPEFIYFWTMAGAALGIARMIRTRRVAAVPLAPRRAA